MAPMLPRSPRQFTQHWGQSPPVNFGVAPISTDPPPGRVPDNTNVPTSPDVSPNPLPLFSRVLDSSSAPLSSDVPHTPLPYISRVADNTSIPVSPIVPLNSRPVSRIPDNLSVPVNPDVFSTTLPPISASDNSNLQDLNAPLIHPGILTEPSITSSVADLNTPIGVNAPLVNSCEQLTPSVPVGLDASTSPSILPIRPCLPENPSVLASNGTPVNRTPSSGPVAGASASDDVTSVNCQAAAGVPDGSTEHVMERCEDITKSESDKRHYRALVLSNNMKVMLVSDSSAETSAAALQVNVGHCSDPDEVPGLAHFCEHMLFLGTEKYPEENKYNKFLSEHGGFSNACTGLDYTKFYFDVLPEHLGTALDIFAQFFIAPLFTESATERELNAVDSEHQKNLQSDGWRLTQLDKNAAFPGHPYRKFGTGNRQTLETVPREKDIDVREELLRFHQRWYSANIMALSVVGKESLDELEAMVVPLFSSVKSSSVETPSWAEHPFPPALRRKRTYCEPVADFRSLAMDFPISEYTREHYVGRPFNYLSHLIGHEGPGSLLSALKKRGWCNSNEQVAEHSRIYRNVFKNLVAGAMFLARGFGFFSINVDLTEEGVQRVDDIVALTFQYIAMLRDRGPLREVYEEQSDLSDLFFRFEDPSEPISLANSLVDVLQEFPSLPMEEVLATWRATEWRPDLVEQALALLTPDNARLQLVAKCFADKCTEKEPWYGTKYLEEDIEPEKIKEWESLELISELMMPPPNEFIPSRVELEARTDSTCEALAPEIIRDTPFMRLWYKQDSEFLLPKASVEFELNSPLPAQSPSHLQLTMLWVMLLEDCLQESTYAAGLAGISWGLDCYLYSISISISGFDDKQYVLLDIIMDRIVHFQPDPRRFDVMKEIIVRGLKNREMDQPCEHAGNEQDACLSGRVWWTTQQLVDATENATVDKLVDYVHRFIRSVYVEGIAFGNLTRGRALRLAEIVESRIPKDSVPVLAQDLLMVRALEIDAGGNYLREIENSVHSSSCVSVYLECGVRDTRPNVLLELLAKVLEEPCFDTLRTKEQLGYIVSGGPRRGPGVQGATVLVQGDAHPALIEERIEAFLQDVQEYLEGMSEEEFARHRTALAALRSERPKQIYSKKAQMWGEIIAQTYNFDRARVEVEALNTVSKDELIQFYKRHISPNSPERRKLSVHVISTAEDGAGPIKKPENMSDNNVDTYNNGSTENDEENLNDHSKNLADSNNTDHNNDKTDKTNNNDDNTDNNKENTTNSNGNTDHNNDKTNSHDGNTDNNKENTKNSNGLTDNKIEKTDYNAPNDNNHVDKHNVITDNWQPNTDNNIENIDTKSLNTDNNIKPSDNNCTTEINNGNSNNSNDKIDNKNHSDNDNNKDNTDKNKENSNNNNTVESKNKQPTKINDLIEFKSRRRLHPLPAAFTAVPLRGS